MWKQAKQRSKPLLFLLALAFPHDAIAQSIEIMAKPIETFQADSPEKKTFGNLEFLGGLELTSSHEEFGGFSAIRFLKDNKLIMVTDKARVITSELVREGNKPLELQNSTLTRIKAANGRTITGATDKDSEALEISGESFFIGYERNDRIIRFSMQDNTLIADGNYLVNLNPLGLPENKGPEAITIHPTTGKLHVFAEQALDENSNHRGFIISGGKIERQIRVKYRDGFSLTDAMFLPDGSLLLLERYFNPFTGVFLRMRKIEAQSVSSSEVLDGKILIDVNNTHEIDNMEGLALSQMEDGSTRITMVSDDNFSALQRTLLLEFRLID